MCTIICLPCDILKIIFSEFDIKQLRYLMLTHPYLYKSIMNSPQLFWGKYLNLWKKYLDLKICTLINGYIKEDVKEDLTDYLVAKAGIIVGGNNNRFVTWYD